MLKEFVDLYMNNKRSLRKMYKEDPPSSYSELVKILFKFFNNEMEDEYERTGNWKRIPDYNNITEIVTGRYQGIILFVIPEYDSYCDRFWAVKCYYGSCSACDTMQRLSDMNYYYEDEEELTVSQEALDGYMTLAMHLVQNMKEI